jgi:hypothetical protein
MVIWDLLEEQVCCNAFLAFGLKIVKKRHHIACLMEKGLLILQPNIVQHKDKILETLKNGGFKIANVSMH